MVKHSFGLFFVRIIIDKILFFIKYLGDRIWQKKNLIDQKYILM